MAIVYRVAQTPWTRPSAHTTLSTGHAKSEMHIVFMLGGIGNFATAGPFNCLFWHLSRQSHAYFQYNSDYEVRIKQKLAVTPQFRVQSHKR